MEIIIQYVNTTLEQFDFSYCITVNILTYIIISIIIGKNINKNINTWIKRIILLLSIIVVGGGYYLSGTEGKILLNSSILAPVFWSWVMKPIFKHFNLDYKQLGLF